MDLIQYYKRHGWIRSAIKISIVVTAILVIVISIQNYFQKKLNDDHMENRCNEISASIIGGVTDALSIGDNDIVRDQFKRLHKTLPEIEVNVYDFNSVISFSTKSENIGKSFKSIGKKSQKFKRIEFY